MTSTNRASPQAFISSYAPRIRTFGNSLLTPVIQPTNNQLPPVRTTKRGTTAINYAEDGFDDDDFDDGERRPTGLRSLRRDEPQAPDRIPQGKDLGKEVDKPVDVQGIWREWMQPSRRRLMLVEPSHSFPMQERNTASGSHEGHRFLALPCVG